MYVASKDRGQIFNNFLLSFSYQICKTICTFQKDVPQMRIWSVFFLPCTYS